MGRFLVVCLIFSITSCTNYDPNSNKISSNDTNFYKEFVDSKINWQKWDKHTLKYIKKENKLVFLFVGYSACFPCHQMRRYTLADKNIISILNKDYVSILIDKDHQLDVGRLYLDGQMVIQKMGRWPLTLILNSELQPIFATSQIPANKFSQALTNLQVAWETRTKELLERGTKLTEYLNTPEKSQTTLVDIEQSQKKFFKSIAKLADSNSGGRKKPPIFPFDYEAKQLLRYSYVYKDPQAIKYIKAYSENLLSKGLYDWVNGGFFRYCVDKQCIRSQYEKLTLNQAATIDFLAENHALFESKNSKIMLENTFQLISTKLTGKNGEFYTAINSESQKKEGYFYLWPWNAIKRKVVKAKLNTIWKKWLHHSSYTGNTSRASRPLLKKSISLSKIEAEASDLKKFIKGLQKNKLKPSIDNQVLTNANGLLIGALAKASRSLQDIKFLRAAEKAALFIKMQNTSVWGELYHSNQKGRMTKAVVDDYSYLIYGLIELYQASFSPQWLSWAKDLQAIQIKKFWDKKNRAFYFTEKNSDFPFKRSYFTDAVYPSANSLSLENLYRLALLTNNKLFAKYSENLANSFPDSIQEQPWAYSQAHMALWWKTKVPNTVIIQAKDSKACTEFRTKLDKEYLPFTLYSCNTSGKKIAQAKVCKKNKCSDLLSASEEVLAYIKRD